MIFSSKTGALLQATEKTLFYACPPAKDKDSTDGLLYLADFWVEEVHQMPVQISEISVDEAMAAIPLTDIKPPQLNWSEADHKLFEKDFSLIQAKLHEGHWQKAVPITYIRSKETDGVFFYCLQNLLQQKNGYIYVYWDENEWMMGLSPELLYEWKKTDGLLVSHAVAGTNFQAANKALQSDPKEILEHELVVRGITEVMSEAAKPNVEINGTMGVGELQHLRAKITAPVKDLKMDDQWIEALHPTPALGAYPLTYRRGPLKELLHSSRRRHFGAPFGLIHPDWHRVVVAIRGIQAYQKEIFLAAGCGVVKTSVLENEWQELQAKLRAIKGYLGLAD